MFSKKHPSEARPNGRSAPKGSVKGKTPSRGGHPVGGKGQRNAAKGVSRPSVRSNMTPSLKGRGGQRTSGKPNAGKAGAY